MLETLRQGGIARLNPDLMKELEVLFLEFSEMKGFPDAYCIPVGKEIEDMGFLRREGFFKLDRPNTKGILYPTHVWGEDAEGVIMDLTAHQFNPHLKNPLFKCVQLIRPGDPLYGKYVPLNSPTVKTD